MCHVWEGWQTIVVRGMPFHPILFIRMPEYVGHLINTFFSLLTAHLGSDWKEHKKSCKRFSASNTVTVKPRYLDGSVEIKPIQQVAREIAGFPSRPTSEAERCPSHEPTKYPKKKIIKVQFTASPAFTIPMLVYDEKRDLFCHIERNDAPEAFDRLVEFVQSNGTFGRKAYLAAELKSKDELVIKIDEALADQPF